MPIMSSCLYLPNLLWNDSPGVTLMAVMLSRDCSVSFGDSENVAHHEDDDNVSSLDGRSGVEHGLHGSGRC